MKASIRLRLLTDLTFFIGFLLLTQPILTGIPLHEWIGVALVAVMAFHLLTQWNWIIQVTRRFFQKVWHKSRLQYVLDVLLLISMGTAFVSGFAISRAVLPALGLPEQHDFFWRALHSLSADLTLFIVAVHVALNWNWVVNACKNLFRRPQARRVTTSAVPGTESIGGKP